MRTSFIVIRLLNSIIETMESKILKESTILEEIIRRLVTAYQPEKIYLFGSVARGEHGMDSDYDLLVIFPYNAPSEHKKSQLAYHVLRGTGIAVDVLVWTKSAFNARLHLKASLPSIIQDEGQLLYAA